ncbi:MAG: GAF domain-containing protein [Anaerolineae bacterium]
MATILYIDPDEVSHRVIQAALSKQYNLVTATDGPTAIQYCAMIQPDLILVDLALPDIDGPELVSRLKMFMPQTPILVIGDLSTQTVRAKELLRTSDGFLTKPIKVGELVSKIRGLLPLPVQLPGLPKLLTEDQAVVSQFESQIAALNQANQRLASLNAISALIGTSLDVEHLMDEILEQIQKTVDFDSATLLLLKGDILEAAASRGFTDYQRGMNIYRKNERNSAWHAVNNKLPLIIQDVTRSEYWEPRPELNQIRSWLGVPLIYKDRVVGVLTLDKNELAGFTDADARYVFTLAYQVAIAVENAQLFEEWEDQATRLKLINEVGQEIVTILEMDDLLKALAKAIYERLSYERVAILQVDEMRTCLTLKAVYGPAPASFQAEVYQQDIGAGLIGKAIKARNSILVNDVSQEPNFLPIEGVTVKSELIVPIFVGNQVEAVIEIHQGFINGFDDHDLWTLSSLSSQAATALANARLYRDLAQRLRDLGVLYDASQALTATISLDEMLTSITNRVCIALLAESGYVLLVENNGKLNFAAASGGNAAMLPATQLHLNVDPLEQIILSGMPQLFKFSAENPGRFLELEYSVQHKIDTMLIAPLKTHGIIIGLIILINKQAGDFNNNDLNLLGALSQLLAGAVENAQLFNQIQAYSDKLERTVQARTERLQAIKKISQVVSQGLDLDELLAKVGQYISQIFAPETMDEAIQVIIGLVDGAHISLRRLYGVNQAAPAAPTKSAPANKEKNAKAAQLQQVVTFRIDSQQSIDQVITQGKPLILNQTGTPNIYSGKGQDEDNRIIHSRMMAPLITGGKTIGLILIESPLINAFSESDLEILESLAFQVASAIEHARLLQKTREIAIVEERTRLAREMHDGVAQNLAYLLIQVDRCLNMVEEGGKLEKQLEQISALLKQNIEEIRRNIFDLRPVELEGKSIFEVMKNFVTEFGRRWNLKTTCLVEGEYLEVPPEVESSLYRILQETLSNARQHARCTHLSVKVNIKDNQWVTLEVTDDGLGFNPNQDFESHHHPRERGSRGLGLISMRERASKLGGDLTVDSNRGKGTRVVATLPLSVGPSHKH